MQRAHRCFSETWGPPYDPHSFADSWAAANEGLSAGTIPAPLFSQLTADIADVSLIEDADAAQTQWKEILGSIHESAIILPFSGKRNPTILNSRLTGYTAGQQQYDYPLHTLTAASGANTITVSPGSQTGLFQHPGRLDAHSYRPNEFWANNWVYEGLVKYGPGGTIEPALATSWTITDIAGSSDQKYTFTLRSGVTFHDGAAWDCSVALLNFQHVFNHPCEHNWFPLATAMKNFACIDSMTFTFDTTGALNVGLQELSYIRPHRMISPTSFFNGAASDPTTQNSCIGNNWNADVPTLTGTGFIDYCTDPSGATINTTCVGILSVSGTGPWKYGGTTYEGGNSSNPVDYSTFDKNPSYWGGAPSLDSITVKRYASASAVKAAVDAGTLDVVIGNGVLAPADIKDIKDNDPDYSVYFGPVLQNRMVILNGNKAPTDDIEVRKAIIHAVDKSTIIESEMNGMEEKEENLFPKTAPNCDVDLTPHWDYDLEKAQLINCPTVTATNTAAAAADDDDSTVAWILVVVFAVLGVVGTCVMFKMGKKKGVDEYLNMNPKSGGA